MAFFKDTALENWTCVNMTEYYHANSGHKSLQKIMDCIKKDLQEVADSNSEFEITHKKKARDILDDWKNWSTQRRTPKRSSGVNIENFHVKKIKQFAGNHATQIMGNNNINLETKKDDYEELRTKVDGEKLQPSKIPPPSVPLPPQTPEHKMAPSSLASPTTESKSDDDDSDFDSDNRDPRNLTFDEYVDGDDEYVDDDDDDVLFLDNSVTFDDANENPYIFQEENISELFISYRSKALQMAQVSGLSIGTNYREILSLSHILLLEADSFSDLQIKEFSRDTLEKLQKNLCNTCVAKVKVTPSVKSIFREYIEMALDEDFEANEMIQTIMKPKSFENPDDQEQFSILQFIFLQLVKNIPTKPLEDILSEGTLTVNIIGPVLRSFFHDPSIHPTIWPNTASMSAKVRKLANLDPSRAKQPDMIGNVVNNNTSKYEMMFGEITGEGKNNNKKKNRLDLIRLGRFMKDSLDLLLNTGDNRILFSWQAIVTSWTGYVMALTAPGLYIMIEIGQVELPKSFQTCGQFIDNVDKLFTFAEKYKYEVRKLRDYINKKKNDRDDIPVKMINWCRTTLGTPQFKKIIKKHK